MYGILFTAYRRRRLFAESQSYLVSRTAHSHGLSSLASRLPPGLPGLLTGFCPLPASRITFHASRFTHHVPFAPFAQFAAHSLVPRRLPDNFELLHRHRHRPRPRKWSGRLACTSMCTSTCSSADEYAVVARAVESASPLHLERD